jgi:hypothetical protein
MDSRFTGLQQDRVWQHSSGRNLNSFPDNDLSATGVLQGRMMRLPENNSRSEALFPIERPVRN